MPNLYASPMGTRVVRLKASHPARPYDDRGWCILETVSALEIVLRARVYAKLAAVLDALPPKIVDIGGAIDGKSFDATAAPTVPEMPAAGDERARIAATREKITVHAGFNPNYPKDRKLALKLLNECVIRGARARRSRDPRKQV